MTEFTSFNPYAQVEALQTACYPYTGENEMAVQDSRTLAISSSNTTPPQFMRPSTHLPCPCGGSYSRLALAFASARTNEGSILIVPNPPYPNPFADMNWVANYQLPMRPQDM